MTSRALTEDDLAFRDRIAAAVNGKTSRDYYTLIPRLEDAGLHMPEQFLRRFPRQKLLLVDYNKQSERLDVFTEYDERVGDFADFDAVKAYQEEHFPGYVFENVGDIPGQHPEDNLICDRRFAFIRSRIDWNQKADRVMAWFAFNDEPTIDNAFNMTDEFFVRIDDRNGGRVVEISTGMGFTQDNEPFVRIPVLTEEMPVIGSGEYEWLTITGESIDDAHIKAAQHIIDNYDWNGQPR